MKKRISVGAFALSLPLCALLLLLLCGTASAAAPALTFALTVDGESVRAASPGDTLTVRFSVLRTDAAEPFALFAIQNEIEFDMDFFEFVENSVVTRYANADASLQTRVQGQQIVKASALGGPEYAAEQVFCEFQLKVKDTATGSGWARCSEAKASDADHAPATIAERNLTVTVSASGGSSSGSGSSGGSSGSSSGSSSGGGSSSGSSGGGSSSGSSSGSGGGSSSSGKSSASSGSKSGSSVKTDNGATVADNGESVKSGGETGQLSGETTPVHTVSDGGDSGATETRTPSVATNEAPVAAACPKDASCPLAAFSDLDPSAWYHDGVHFCVENGIMNGFSDGTFGPQRNVSRAQLAMILWNREGRPAADTELTFKDTDANGWYAGAVRWALQKGILTGYSADAFGPNDVLTRQQLAAILYRYGGAAASSDALEKLSAYEDAAQIGSYARNALAWAVDAGLIQGTTPVTLNPRGNATRAQTAVIITRYLSNAKEGA